MAHQMITAHAPADNDPAIPAIWDCHVGCLRSGEDRIDIIALGILRRVAGIDVGQANARQLDASRRRRRCGGHSLELGRSICSSHSGIDLTLPVLRPIVRLLDNKFHDT